jgi:hypothetical protein
MTSRERMAAVLSGRIPDRVPFHPTIYVDHACLASGRQFEAALLLFYDAPELAPALIDKAVAIGVERARAFAAAGGYAA